MRSNERHDPAGHPDRHAEWPSFQAAQVAQYSAGAHTGLRGEMSVAEVCREHQISETLFYTWREKLLEGGAERLSGKEERTELVELRKRVRDLERTLGRKTYELEILGNGFRTWE